MSESPEMYLRRMFESDTSAPDYYEKNSRYAVDARLGAKPWWPPLSEVWRVGEVCPPNYQHPNAWRDAWQLLQRLHEQYRAAE